jgi:hypothetical protein
LKSQRHIAIAMLVASALAGRAQTQPPPTTAAPTPTAAMETLQELRDRISAAQRQQLDDAMAAFQAQRYAEALGILNDLRDRHPRDPVLAKFASEASINTGDRAFAIATLTPLLQTDPSDWQAVGLLARACAESSDTACRDAQMSHMLDLHRQGLTPAGVNDYPVEHIAVGANTLIVSRSLEPFGRYKIYALGKVSNPDGKLFLTITIESNDSDQPGFAKEHPKEAAQGMRLFSLDAYAETGLNQAGQRTQTHYTFQFFNGQPTYDVIRESFIKVAGGKASPLSSRSGLIVP